MLKILLSENNNVVSGLVKIDEIMFPDGGCFCIEKNEISLEEAAYLIEIAKLAPDVAEFFPKGKWATIQAIQGRIEGALKEGVGRLKESVGGNKK